MVRAGRWCVRVPSAAPIAPGLLLAGGPAARPPPVGAEMAGPGAAAGCARRVLEQLRRVSSGLGSRGPAGAEQLRQGSRSSSAPGRPACTRPLLAAGKGAGRLGRQCGRPKGEPVSFPIPKLVDWTSFILNRGQLHVVLLTAGNWSFLVMKLLVLSGA